MSTYKYIIKTADADTLGWHGFETENYDAAMLIVKALEKNGETVTMSQQLISSDYLV